MRRKRTLKKPLERCAVRDRIGRAIQVANVRFGWKAGIGYYCDEEVLTHCPGAA